LAEGKDHAMEFRLGPRRRYHELYRDHKVRQHRLHAMVEEKQRKEEEAVRQQLEATRGRRAYDKDYFMDWYEERVGQYRESVEARTEWRRARSVAKAGAELAECTFQPRSNSPGGALGAVPRAQACAGGQTDAPPPNPIRTREAREAAAELVRLQQLHVEAMRALCDRARQAEIAARHEAADGLELALEESKRRLRNFAETEEGQAYLAERARRIMETHGGGGIDESSCLREAHDDLVRASEAKLRTQTDAAMRRRLQQRLQPLHLGRMEVVLELIHLQKRYAEIRTGLRVPGAPPAVLDDFDAGFLDRLTREPWYSEAKERAQYILQAEQAAPPGSLNTSAASLGASSARR